MHQLKYMAGYPDKLVRRAGELLAENRLADYLRDRYPAPHEIRTDRALYDYTLELKNEYLRSSRPISRVAYDGRIGLLHSALGLHTFVSRVQGGNLKAKNEIRIAALFRDAPLQFLRMIVVHELAHLKEREHDKAFYRLCEYMEPAYHQLEFDARLYLTQLELAGSIYGEPRDDLACREGQ
ncbi:MAG TPA: M48 family metallopeptidase [Geobacteraceae bacterium]|nr:M48 family metallopeptidase [Geobacteraceae bacterium]